MNSDNFLDKSCKAQARKAKLKKKWNLSKTQKLLYSKGNYQYSEVAFNRMEKKIFVSYLSDKGWIFKIYNRVYKLNNKSMGKESQ